MAVGAHGDFVSTEIAWASSSDLRFLRHFDLTRDRGNDRLRHLLLHCENVFQDPVIALRPYMVACQCINELSGHTNAIRQLADAALYHVPDAEFLADLTDVWRFALVGEGRVAGDHEQRVKARQLGDDI